MRKSCVLRTPLLNILSCKYSRVCTIGKPHYLLSTLYTSATQNSKLLVLGIGTILINLQASELSDYYTCQQIWISVQFSGLTKFWILSPISNLLYYMSFYTQYSWIISNLKAVQFLSRGQMLPCDYKVGGVACYIFPGDGISCDISRKYIL